MCEELAESHLTV